MDVWRRAVTVAVAALLAAAPVSAQPAGRVTPTAFRVTLGPEYDPVASRIEGIVENRSEFRVTNVRVEVRGVAADGRVVGRAFPWTIGDIEAGGESSFLFDAMPDAVQYESAVVSFDIVSGPIVPRQY